MTQHVLRLAVAFFAVLAGSLAGAPARAADAIPVDPAEPRAVVEATVAAALGALGDPVLTEAERRHRVEEIAYRRFDFETMSKLVLARGWRRFSSAERDEFVREFKLLLSRSYGGRLDRYGKERVEVAGTQLEPRGDVTVKTMVVGGGFDGVTIDYRMRRVGAGEWKAIDVVVEGVSLVSSYRSQFRDLLAQGGPSRLLEQMREKNASAEEDDTEAAGSASAVGG